MKCRPIFCSLFGWVNFGINSLHVISLGNCECLFWIHFAIKYMYTTTLRISELRWNRRRDGYSFLMELSEITCAVKPHGILQVKVAFIRLCTRSAPSAVRQQSLLPSLSDLNLSFRKNAQSVQHRLAHILCTWWQLVFMWDAYQCSMSTGSHTVCT